MFSPASERGPFVVQSLALNLAQLALAQAEPHGDLLAGLGYRHLLVLGLDQGQEDFPPAFLREQLLRTILLHGNDPSIGVLPASERPSSIATLNRKSVLKGKGHLVPMSLGVSALSRSQRVKAQAEAVDVNHSRGREIAILAILPKFPPFQE